MFPETKIEFSEMATEDGNVLRCIEIDPAGYYMDENSNMKPIGTYHVLIHGCYYQGRFHVNTIDDWGGAMKVKEVKRRYDEYFAYRDEKGLFACKST